MHHEAMQVGPCKPCSPVELCVIVRENVTEKMTLNSSLSDSETNYTALQGRIQDFRMGGTGRALKAPVSRGGVWVSPPQWGGVWGGGSAPSPDFF